MFTTMAHCRRDCWSHWRKERIVFIYYINARGRIYACRCARGASRLRTGTTYEYWRFSVNFLPSRVFYMRVIEFFFHLHPKKLRIQECHFISKCYRIYIIVNFVCKYQDIARIFADLIFQESRSIAESRGNDMLFPFLHAQHSLKFLFGF